MGRNERHFCCQPLVAALSDDGRAEGGAALVVRADPDGALYFKIAAGSHDHEFIDTNINEPAAFCPFCGAPVADGQSSSPSLRPAPEDDELTVLARPAPTLVTI